MNRITEELLDYFIYSALNEWAPREEISNRELGEKLQMLYGKENGKKRLEILHDEDSEDEDDEDED